VGVEGCCAHLDAIEQAASAVNVKGGAGFLDVFGQSSSSDQHQQSQQQRHHPHNALLLHPNNNNGGGGDGASAVSLEMNQVKRRSYDMSVTNPNNTAGSTNRHSELTVPGHHAAQQQQQQGTTTTGGAAGGGGAVSKTHNHPHRMSYTGSSINEKKAVAAASSERPTSSTMGRPAASAHRNPTGRRGGKVSSRNTHTFYIE
jgi:hypothetical protein